MIVSALLELLHGLAVLVFGTIHSVLPAAPSFWSDLTGALDDVIGQIPGPIKYFVPLAPLTGAGLTVLLLLVALSLVKLLRRVVSLLSGGGGSV